MQLCEGLLASGRDPEKHAVPALGPVVEDVFVVRSNKSDKKKELEATREVMIATLLRLLESCRAIELLVMCLDEAKFGGEGEREDKWRSWSRLAMDALLAALVEGGIPVESERVYMALVKLCRVVSPTVFRPVDPLLQLLLLLFKKERESVANLPRWLATLNLVVLVLVSYSKEQVMLARLQDLVTRRPDLVIGDDLDQDREQDPLNATRRDTTTVPQVILARLVLRVVRVASSAISASVGATGGATANLAHQLSLFLQLCIQMAESGSHGKLLEACAGSILELEGQVGGGPTLTARIQGKCSSIPCTGAKI